MSEPFDAAEYIAKLREESPELEGIDAAEAARADRDKEIARRMDERDVVNGNGTPPLEIVEGLLGTPWGDEHAQMYGLDLGNFTVEQITAMHENGMSWAEIGKRATARRNIAR